MSKTFVAEVDIGFDASAGEMLDMLASAQVGFHSVREELHPGDEDRKRFILVADDDCDAEAGEIEEMLASGQIGIVHSVREEIGAVASGRS